MKKFSIFIGLILTFFVIYFLQVNIFNNFTIAGIKPNLFIIYILFIGLFANQILGIIGISSSSSSSLSIILLLFLLSICSNK